MKKTNWGIMGAGAIAGTFATTLNFNESSVLYAIASRTIEKANIFASEYQVPHAYGSYEELVKDENIDVVYIATPMESHYKDVMLCLENNKNVFCEKSVTLNLNELEEILAKAKEKNLFFMEAMWMKCMPAFLKALEIVKSGGIGDVQMIKADFCLTRPFDEESRLFKKDCGGGALLDLGIYPITFATSFLGNNPNEIISNARMGQSGVDFDNTVLLRYDNNVFASLRSGMSAHSKNNATIVGTKGSIYFDEGFLNAQAITIYDENHREVETLEYAFECNGYEYEIRELEKCLLENRAESKLVPLEDTIATMKIMDTCREQWGFKYINE